ncbi:MAG: 4-hydroxy-tetrahydrodipicolinate reductase [Pseudomonadota bacterium]
MIKVGIFGSSGRMGHQLIRSVSRQSDMSVSGGICHEPFEDITIQLEDQKTLSVKIFKDAKSLAEASDVVIDFTIASVLDQHIEACYDVKTPMVIGTTGFGDTTKNNLHEASKIIPILQAGNMSLGVNLLSALVKQAASALGEDWDIEITEAHHRMKVDAPSGTALLLGEAAAEGRERTLSDVQKLSREGHTGQRPTGEIGFSTIRAGAIIGDHSVMFAHDNEIITLSHRAQDRKIFADGAVYAARKLISLSPKLYDMIDILDIRAS